MADAREARTRFARLAVLALAALLFALLRIPFAAVPLERDEGEYAYIAQRALAGDVPYRDTFDQKPPGVFVVYMAAFALFGPSVESIHAFMYLWTAATCAALFVLVRRAVGGLAASFAVLVFAIATIDPRLAASAANTEIFMLLPLVAATACLLRALDSDGAGWWLACGALAATACWFKPVALANAVFIAVFAAGDLVVRRGRVLSRALLRLGLLLAAGAAAVSAPVLVSFAVLGAWEPFVDAVFVHNLAYARRLPATAGLRNAVHALAWQAPSFALYWALAAWALVRPGLVGRRGWALLAGFAVASWVGVASGFYFRAHYFIQGLPALAALCGATAGALASRALARHPTAAWAGVGALSVLLVAPPLVANRSLLWGASPAEISRWIYGLNPFVESPKVADYIRRTSGPDDAIYVVGSEPQILFYAQRRSATRYIFFYPLMGPFPDALERQRELIREVEAERPLYVVWANIPASMLVLRDSERYVFDATAQLIDRHYRLEFLARPPPEAAGSPSAEFEFVYGTRARQLLTEARAAGEATPWIAVFRRGS